MSQSEFITVTLPCGHTLPFDAATQNALGFDLPQGRFQCRQCGQAWQVIKGVIQVATDSKGSFLYSDPNIMRPVACEF